ncbi:MAG: hypothetical protein LBO66_10900 [Deltaproteobacteria bacterium]|jgi:hypothetical protein|nr:hypothetical protein [Deltaproteobacteria bacterium]
MIVLAEESDRVLDDGGQDMNARSRLKEDFNVFFRQESVAGPAAPSLAAPGVSMTSPVAEAAISAPPKVPAASPLKRAFAKAPA